MNIYFHWTEKKNLRNILRCGLQGKFALGAKKVVWCFRKGSESAAMKCVLKHHAVNPMDLVLLKIRVDLNEIRTHCDGLYYSRVDVPPGAVEVAGGYERKKCRKR